MSKWDKLIKRISNETNDVRFDEVKRILEYYGYTMNYSGNGGSHCTFRKKGKNPITIPKRQQIKKIYILMVKKVVEEETRNEEN